MAETLKEKTTKGLFWGGLSNVVLQGVGLVFGIILGRLLSPYDYGMTAMILVFQLLATALQESGFKSAIGNLKEPQHRDYNAVFWFNITVGAACYVVLFCCAPLIARYYHTPELVPLCRYAFLNVIFASLGTAQSAYLFRNLKVKEQAKAGMAAILMSNIVGAVMAWMGCGYWSLATQSILYIALNSSLLWYYSPWRPTFDIDFQPIRQMFRFSSKLLATTILERINTNVMNILLGRYFTTAEVGKYNQAYQWSSKVFYLLQGTLAQVAQPVFTNVADERERQLRILRKLMRFTAFLSFPMLLGFGLVAQEFIVLAIGEKWIESARLLQLLCISGAFIPICSVLTNLLISKGKSGTYFWVTLVLCITLIATMLALHPYGIRVMVKAYVIIYILWTLVWHFFVSRQTGYTLWALLLDIVPFAMIALGVMVATGWVSQTVCNWLLAVGTCQLVVLLVTRIVMAAILYYVVMRMLRVKIFDECIMFIKERIKRK